MPASSFLLLEQLLLIGLNLAHALVHEIERPLLGKPDIENGDAHPHLAAELLRRQAGELVEGLYAFGRGMLRIKGPGGFGRFV